MRPRVSSEDTDEVLELTQQSKTKWMGRGGAGRGAGQSCDVTDHAGLGFFKRVANELVVLLHVFHHGAVHHITAERNLHRVVNGAEDEDRFVCKLGHDWTVDLLGCCLDLFGSVGSLCNYTVVVPKVR